VSIFVEYDQWSRMGNRMFQYALGYILSQEKKTVLYADGIPNFDISSTRSGMTPKDPIYTKSHGNNYLKYNELLNTERDIVVNSYVQRAQYYIPYRDMLKAILGVKNEPCINCDRLVVHIRETDYTQINCFLGYEYYHNLIKESGYSDIIIVTDNSKCDTVQRLMGDGCTLNTCGYVDKFEHICDNRAMMDFMTLLKSENIALSQSSFSWWAAFLGQHEKIIFPYTEQKSMWPLNPGKDDINLYFDLGSSQKFIK